MSQHLHAQYIYIYIFLDWGIHLKNICYRTCLNFRQGHLSSRSIRLKAGSRKGRHLSVQGPLANPKGWMMQLSRIKHQILLGVPRFQRKDIGKAQRWVVDYTPNDLVRLSEIQWCRVLVHNHLRRQQHELAKEDARRRYAPWHIWHWPSLGCQPWLGLEKAIPWIPNPPAVHGFCFSHFSHRWGYIITK